MEDMSWLHLTVIFLLGVMVLVLAMLAIAELVLTLT